MIPWSFFFLFFFLFKFVSFSAALQYFSQSFFLPFFMFKRCHCVFAVRFLLPLLTILGRVQVAQGSATELDQWRLISLAIQELQRHQAAEIQERNAIVPQVQMRHIGERFQRRETILRGKVQMVHPQVQLVNVPQIEHRGVRHRGDKVPRHNQAVHLRGEKKKRRKTSKRARVRRHLNRSGQLSRRVLWCRRAKQDTAEQTWHKYPEENEKNRQWMEERGGEWENVDQCTCFMSATTSGTVVKWLNASTRSLRCFRWRISSGRSRRWFAWRCSAFRLHNEKNWRAKQTKE